MATGDAVRAADDGCLLLVAASPGAREDRFPDGFDPWRKRLGVRVAAPPEDGKANRAVCRLVATFFGDVPVEIESGHTSGLKTLRVRGVSRDDAVARLEAALV